MNLRNHIRFPEFPPRLDRAVRFLDRHVPGGIRYDLTAAYIAVDQLIQTLHPAVQEKPVRKKPASTRQRMSLALEEHVKFLPLDGQWASRVSWEHAEEFRKLATTGAPVVNCFMHHDYHTVMRLLMRSQGVTTYALSRSKPSVRNVPHVAVQLFTTDEFLSAGKSPLKGCFTPHARQWACP